MCGIDRDADGYKMIANSDYMKLYLNNKNQKEWDRVQYTKNFVWYLRHEGHTVVELELNGETPAETAKITKLLKGVLKSIKNGQRDTHNEDLSKALWIDIKTREQIEKKIEEGKFTDEEKLQHDKAKLVGKYGLDTDEPPEGKEWYDTYNNKNTLAHFQNQKIMTKHRDTSECLISLKHSERALLRPKESRA